MKKKHGNNQKNMNVSYTYKKLTAICIRIRPHIKIHQCNIHLCQIRNTWKNNKPVEVNRILLGSINYMLIYKKTETVILPFWTAKFVTNRVYFFRFFFVGAKHRPFFSFIFRLLKIFFQWNQVNLYLLYYVYQWYNLSSLLTF